MDSSASASEKQSSQSSGNEKTPNSDSRIHPYTKSTKSPSLQAFYSFEEALAQFRSHFLTKYDDVGHGNVDEMRKILEAMDKKCKSMKNEFADFILRLNEAIELYKVKKPTDLAADASSITSPEKQVRNRSMLFKDNQTIKEMFDVLNQCIVTLGTAIGKKVHKSMYEDYSCSMDKKLKNLKVMCENMYKELERIEKKIKNAIEENNTSNDG